MREYKLISALILLILIIISLNSLDLYTTVRQKAANNPDSAIKAILKQPLAKNTTECEQVVNNRRTHLLATAILLVENSVTNPIEKRVEFAIAKWLPSLLLYLDLSVGPAQIKPSSFKQANLSGEARISASINTCQAIATVAGRIENTANYDGSYESRRIFYKSHTGIYKNPIYNIIYAKLVDGVFYRLSINDTINIDLKRKTR